MTQPNERARSFLNRLKNQIEHLSNFDAIGKLLPFSKQDRDRILDGGASGVVVIVKVFGQCRKRSCGKWLGIRVVSSVS